MRAPVHHTEEDIKKMIAESRRQMMLNAKVVETEEVHAPKVTTSPPVNPVEVARAEYWREYRQRWLAVAMAVAGGMLGGALVLQIEMWREWMY